MADVQLASISGGSGIKQIIRGTISAAAGATNTATISSVVTGKSIISNLGTTNSGTGASAARVDLTNSTTVTATMTASSGSILVGYQIVEYY